MSKETLMEQLGIEYIEETHTGYLKTSMSVDERTFQPMRILHGGTKTKKGLKIDVKLDETSMTNKFDTQGNDYFRGEHN